MVFRSTIFLAMTAIVLAGAARAAPLCGAQCELTIGFPNGGRIVAQRPVTFTFGDSGPVNTVGSVTAYLDGETLTLGSGGRLDFGVGGSFDIGDLVFKAATVSIGGGLELSANGEQGMFNDIATGCGITAHATDAVRISLVTVAVTADNTACQRLLAGALVEVIDPGGSDTPPPVTDESSDSTAFPPTLAMLMLLLSAIAFARRGGLHSS